MDRSFRAAAGFLLGLVPISVPLWAAGIDAPTTAAFIAAGLACWAVTLLLCVGMDGQPMRLTP